MYSYLFHVAGEYLTTILLKVFGLVELQPRTSEHFFHLKIMKEIEIWKQFKDTYFYVSNMGRIMSARNSKNSIFIDESIPNGVFLKQGYSKGCKYLRVGINGSMKVHRVVSLTFIPNPDNLPEINHINGIKDDNRACNLEWTTPELNRKHALDTGLIPSKEKMSNAKLNMEKVVNIRKEYKEGLFSQRQLAGKYNVSRNCIRCVLSNKSWVV